MIQTTRDRILAHVTELDHEQRATDRKLAAENPYSATRSLAEMGLAVLRGELPLMFEEHLRARRDAVTAAADGMIRTLGDRK